MTWNKLSIHPQIIQYQTSDSGYEVSCLVKPCNRGDLFEMEFKGCIGKFNKVLVIKRIFDRQYKPYTILDFYVQILNVTLDIILKLCEELIASDMKCPEGSKIIVPGAERYLWYRGAAQVYQVDPLTNTMRLAIPHLVEMGRLLVGLIRQIT